MDIEQAKQLLEKYHAGTCTEAEKALVENAFLTFNEQEVDLSEEELEEMGDEVYSRLPMPKPKRVNLWHGAVAVAAIALLTIAGSWWFDSYRQSAPATLVKDVAPGANKATLTLANGQSIDLSSEHSGLEVGDKTLNYVDGSPLAINGAEAIGQQKLSTPNGGQYQLVLADGTKVWLNAASALTYPQSFNGASQREVQLEGEAYFEVASNPSKPFIVKTAMQRVQVVGTHFNINSYNDEGLTQTTLLEGAVKVFGLHTGDALLQPGQQALVNSKSLEVVPADIQLTMAWKNGKLAFRNAHLPEIMQQVSRWYNVEVIYEGDVTDRVFTGSVSRSSQLSVLLKILAYSNIKTKLLKEDHRIKLIVSP